MRVLNGFVFIFTFVHCAFPCTVTISDIKAKAVYGRVVDEYKAAIPYAKVQIYKDTENGEKVLSETKADENGRFEIKNFPAGKYMIRAGAEYFTYSFASMKLKKSSSAVKSKEIVFTLVPFGSCSGWVEMQKIQKSK